MASSHRPRQLLAVDPVCAVCDSEVTTTQGAGHKINATSALYPAFAWCRLPPCGHTVTVPAGGLIR